MDAIDLIIDYKDKKVNDLITQRVGRVLLKFFIDTYSKESYYYNNNLTPWAARQNRNNPKPLLYDTGNMKSNFHIQYGVSKFTLINTVPYAVYHQEGTEYIPSRPILYADKKVIDLIKSTAVAEVTKYLGF